MNLDEWGMMNEDRWVMNDFRRMMDDAGGNDDSDDDDNDDDI